MCADPEVETPKMDESAMEGAIGINNRVLESDCKIKAKILLLPKVVTLAAVIIAQFDKYNVIFRRGIYICAIVVGSMSSQVTKLALPAAWNTKDDKFASICEKNYANGLFSSVERSRRWIPMRVAHSAWRESSQLPYVLGSVFKTGFFTGKNWGRYSRNYHQRLCNALGAPFAKTGSIKPVFA